MAWIFLRPARVGFRRSSIATTIQGWNVCAGFSSSGGIPDVIG
jgi:hypothetical protein